MEFPKLTHYHSPNHSLNPTEASIPDIALVDLPPDGKALPNYNPTS